MSVFDLHFNKDDTVLRNILIGLLATLSDNIKWYNQIGHNIEERRLINVPFYFSTTGTERYLNDNFLNNLDFDLEMNEAETFYNKIPRGIVNFDGFSIDTQAIVNKYVRMNHVIHEQDGTLNTYNSEVFWVPITMDFTTSIYVDSILDQLKASESLIKTFFKSKKYEIDVLYTRIPCLISFPDDYNLERTVEFSFTDKKEFKVDFTIQVKSSIPIFKEGTTIFAGNRMETLIGNTFIPPVQFGPSGGGNALLNNQDRPSPTGQFGNQTIIGATYPGPTTTWPISPSGDLPPIPGV